MKITTLFFLRNDKHLNGKQLPIYLRVTIEGARFVWSTQRYVEANKWSGSTGKVKGTTEEAKTINSHLDLIKHKVFVYQKELILEQRELTISSFKAKWLGRQDSGQKILEVFKSHNEKLEKLVSKDFAQGTVERYRTSYDHTQKFIAWKYGVAEKQA